MGRQWDGNIPFESVRADRREMGDIRLMDDGETSGLAVRRERNGKMRQSK
jgi:hypothetical protein